MQINSYKFGVIKINEQIYTDDIIIFPDKIHSPWWRKEGHKLYIEDIKEVIEYSPQNLIIGTGKSGFMKIPKKTINYLENMNIKVYIYKTPQAVKKFNKIDKNYTVAALHLTC